jgi:hypothetical protein
VRAFRQAGSAGWACAPSSGRCRRALSEVSIISAGLPSPGHREGRASRTGDVSRRGVRHLEVGGSLEDEKGAWSIAMSRPLCWPGRWSRCQTPRRRPLELGVSPRLGRPGAGVRQLVSPVEVTDTSSWLPETVVSRPWCHTPRSGHLVATPLEMDGSRGSGEPAPEAVSAGKVSDTSEWPAFGGGPGARGPAQTEGHTPGTSPNRRRPPSVEAPHDLSDASNGRLDVLGRDAREVQRFGRRVPDIERAHRD